MIKKIDIEKFGLFADYNWNLEVGNDSDKDILKKVNIIYGRNYSGKTTLSRIFRCVEKQEMHKDYLDAKFQLTFDDNSHQSESNLICNKKIRVYNTDFVKDNLSILQDEETGDIKPFALLGETNIEKEKEIQLLKEKLGSESESGLKKDLFKQDKEISDSKRTLKIQKDSLENSLKFEANNTIKLNEKYFLRTPKKKDYITTDMKSEMLFIIESEDSFLMDKKEQDSLVKFLTEVEKPIFDKEIQIVIPNITLHIEKVKELYERRISINDTIDELVKNGELQRWVEQGLKYHHTPEDKCGFCGNNIGLPRWDKLKSHFNKDFEKLNKDITDEISTIEKGKTLFDSYLDKQEVTKDIFYNEYISKYEQILISWNNGLSEYKNILEQLISKLQERLNDIFNPKPFDLEIKDILKELTSPINALNDLIIENNARAVSLFSEKQNVRQKLRYSLLSTFIDEIDYVAKTKENIKCENEISAASLKLNDLQNEIKKIENEIKDKENEFEDEHKAAVKINNHLNDFFGHDGLYFDVEEKYIDDGEVQKTFKIKRGIEDAKNLSEGECSLVAFCYFMAKIEDELNGALAPENLIIYIDDPISSLDNNHIFFMFGLIESVIVSGVSKTNEKFNQLFISTHNLDFLKYLHHLQGFKATYQDRSSYVNYFLIEKIKKGKDSRSRLRLMPKQMRLQTTEYIYLFKQIYNMAIPYIDIEDKILEYENQYTLLYNIGNVMRKFLESFLSFKYAGEAQPLHLLKEFFSSNESSQLNRAPNEYSHLSWLEKGTTLLDVPEAERIAAMILKGIKRNDVTHYNSLCKKIDVDPNIV